MRRRIQQMQVEVNEFMAYVKKELARGIDDWEQRLSTALVKSTPTDLVRAATPPRRRRGAARRRHPTAAPASTRAVERRIPRIRTRQCRVRTSRAAVRRSAFRIQHRASDTPHSAFLHRGIVVPAMACPLCDDTGWKRRRCDGSRGVERCDCWRQALTATLIDDARIPPRYHRCDLRTCCSTRTRNSCTR